MNFKVGDIVKYKKIYMSIYNEYDNYIVINIQGSLLNLSHIKAKYETLKYNGYGENSLFELDKEYYRKQKIKQLKS